MQQNNEEGKEEQNLEEYSDDDSLSEYRDENAEPDEVDESYGKPLEIRVKRINAHEMDIK